MYLGMNLGIGLQGLLDELTGKCPNVVLVNDNQVDITSIMTQVTSWRTDIMITVLRGYEIGFWMPEFVPNVKGGFVCERCADQL